MAKKSAVNRNEAVKALVAKYAAKRAALKAIANDTRAVAALPEPPRTPEAWRELPGVGPYTAAAAALALALPVLAQTGVDSLRAVEKCTQHPGKMWVVRGARMLPLLPFGPAAQPWHSTPYQALPEVYVQNASLEIAWTRVVTEQRTIAGTVIVPFITEGHEGFDINDPYDWRLASMLVDEGAAALPPVSAPPFPGSRPTSR